MADNTDITTQDQPPKLTIDEFAAKIKAKYPSYANVDNKILTDKILAKYPEYGNSITTGPIKPTPPSSLPAIEQPQLPLSPLVGDARQQAIQQRQDEQSAMSNRLKKLRSELPVDAQQHWDTAMQAASLKSPDQIRDGSADLEHYNFMQTPLGKTLGAVQYLGSKATKGGLQVARGVAHLAQNIGNPVSAIMGNDSGLNDLFDKANDNTNFGLTKGDQSRIETGGGLYNNLVNTGGMAAEFAPAIAGGEALGSTKALMYLQGLGQGQEQVANLEKNGQSLNPAAKELLIQGSGVVNLALEKFGDNILGKVPNALRTNVVNGIVADAVKESAGKDLTQASFKELLNNGVKTFADKFERAPVEALRHYNETAKTLTKLNVGNYLLHKGVDAVNDKPVFNDTIGGLAEQESKTLTHDAPLFSAIPALRELTKLAPNSSYKNDVVESVMNDPSHENVTAIKQQLYDHGFHDENPNKWTPEEMDATFKHIDQIADVAKKVPSTLAPDKKEKAIDLILGRNELEQALKVEQDKRAALDPSMAELPTAKEQFLTDKIDQANDKLKSLVTGKRTTYSKGVAENEGKFFKTTDGKQEEIAPARYEMERTEREAKAQDETTKNSLINSTDNGINETEMGRQRNGQENGQGGNESNGSQESSQENGKSSGSEKNIREEKGDVIDLGGEQPPINAAADEQGPRNAQTENTVQEQSNEQKPAGDSGEKATEAPVGEAAQSVEEVKPVRIPKVIPEYKDIREGGGDTPEKLASRVNEKTWYHGSGKDLSKETVDSAGFSRADGLLGLGFYMTDNPEIADTYSKLRRNNRAGIVNEFKVHTDKILDAEKPVDDKVEDVYKRVFRALFDSNEEANKYFDDVKKQNPKASLMDFHKAARELIVDHEMTHDDALEFFQDLEIQLKDELGYDAISHIGGVQTNGKKHNVIILLDPGAQYTSPRKTIKGASIYDSHEDAPVEPKPVESKKSWAQKAYIDSRDLPKSNETVKADEKAGDPLRAFADKVRQGKINKLGGFRASTGFDGAWDASLEVVAKAAEGGAKIADAIEAGLKHIKSTDWYKNLTNKEEFDQQYRDHLSNEYTEVEKALPAKNEANEKVASELGLKVDESNKGKRTNEVIEKEAADAIKKGYDVPKLVDNILNDGHTATDTEVAILAKYRDAKYDEIKAQQEQLASEGATMSKKQFEALTEANDASLNEMQDVVQAIRKTGSSTGSALRARQLDLQKEYSLGNMIAQKRQANGGEKLSSEELASVTKRFAEMEEIQKQLEARLKNVEEQNAKLKAEQAIKRERGARRAVTKSELAAERSKIFDSIRDDFKKIRQSGQAMSDVPYRRELAAVAKHMPALLRNLAQEGVVRIEDVVDNIYTALKGDLEDITKRDVTDLIAGKYNEVKPTRSELQDNIKSLRVQAKLIAQIEDAEKGIKPTDKPPVVKQKNEAIDALKARLKELTKGELPSPEEKSLAALKKRLQDNIDKLSKKIAEGDYSKEEPKKPVTPDAEALALRRKYDKIKNEFDIEVAKDALKQRSKTEKLKDNLLNIASLPRALKASLDFSAVLRQGLFASVGHPKEALTAFKEMFRQTFSEEKYRNWISDLKHSEFYDLMKNSELYLSDKDDPKIIAREEEFTSNLADKIPGIGKAIAASERAYTGYLNVLRAGVFESQARELIKRGYTFENNPEVFKGMAKVINVLTGRGDVPEFLGGKTPKVLSNVLFSPRFMAARIQTLYLWADPRLPREAKLMAAKDIGATLGAGIALLSLASLAGYKVDTDPRSTQFLKIQDKNENGTTYYDILGGLPQYIRLLSQIATGKTVSSTGKVTDLSAKHGKHNPFGQTRGDVELRFLRGKLSPVIGGAINLQEGRDVIGNPYNFWPQVPLEFVPLPYTDVQEAYQVGGIKNALKVLLPSQFGVSVSSYNPNAKHK